MARQDILYQGVVGEPGQCHADYPSAPVWQDAEHEHGGTVFLCKLCRQRRAVPGAVYLERGKVQGIAGHLPGDQPVLCQCEREELPGRKSEDVLADYGFIYTELLSAGMCLDDWGGPGVL